MIISQTNSNDIKELFDKIHPGKQELNIFITQFLLKLGIQTIEDLVKSDLMQLLKKVEETIPNYIELIEMYWQYFLQVVYEDCRRAKQPAWNENFDKAFINFIRGISAIHYFQDVLRGVDYLITEFEDLKKDNEKVITNQKKFVERAYKEVKFMSKFADETMAQINSRKVLSESELQEREKQLQHLKSLFSEYDKFNLIIVKNDDEIYDLDSAWLDDVGGHLRSHINFIESLKLEKLVPWTDNEIVKAFLIFWKYKALA